MKTLAIRVSDEDHKLFTDLAAREDMPLSILVRRVLRAHAREIGFIKDHEPHKPEPVKPQVIRVPIPQGPNAWRDEIYRRVKDGESEQAVADSYGVSMQVIKGKLKSAEHERKVASMPVYAPVDPDNPTLDEQKANAERARLRLQEMGLL